MSNVHAVTEWRRRTKQRAVDYLGGKCSECGYNRCLRAMVFHHRDPKKKDFAISGGGNTRAWEKMKAELDKCVLLCSNCHAEEHDKLFQGGANGNTTSC